MYQASLQKNKQSLFNCNQSDEALQNYKRKFSSDQWKAKLQEAENHEVVKKKSEIISQLSIQLALDSTQAGSIRLKLTIKPVNITLIIFIYIDHTSV